MKNLNQKIIHPPSGAQNRNMKIELENITLGHSPLTDSIFAGVGNGRVWKHKKDVTNSFIDCVLSRWTGYKETIVASDGKKYEISVKELKK